jgi:hypothetical protein
MTTELVNSIKLKLAAFDQELIQPATKDAVQAAENELKLEIPELLRDCLTKVANGGFGPGYGLVGVGDGYQSDLGNLSSAFQQIQKDKESVGQAWPEKMLPFCEWGSAIFSCVDCSTLQVWTFRNFELEPTDLNLREFFERWLKGETSELLESTSERRKTTIRNPFTGECTEVSEA